MKLSAKQKYAMAVLQDRYNECIINALLRVGKEMDKICAMQGAMQACVDRKMLSIADLGSLMDACGVFEYDFSGLQEAGFKF